jgi:Bacteriophage HK97-gp10, putative tail-component
MGRVSNWNPQKYDQEFASASMDRLRKAAEVIAEKARAKCPVGTVSRPIYKRGPYAGQPWTARDAGALKKTIRVVERIGDEGKPLAEGRNIRVYCGNYITYYAKIVEYGGRAFLRPALNESKDEIRNILENG